MRALTRSRAGGDEEHDSLLADRASDEEHESNAQDLRGHSQLDGGLDFGKRTEHARIVQCRADSKQEFIHAAATCLKVA